ELRPPFTGCPAINVMQDAIAERLREFADDVRVDVSFAEPWTTERISDAGRAALRLAGFAPPPGDDLVAECPYCSSRNTRMDNLFGPTLCRAIYYCSDCRQPFEQFKLVYCASGHAVPFCLGRRSWSSRSSPQTSPESCASQWARSTPVAMALAWDRRPQ